MPFKKNNPGCNASSGSCGCSVTCDIVADTFDRPDSSDINAGAPFTWNVRAGAFQIAGQFLECTTANSLALVGTGHPDNIASAVVSAEVLWGGNDGARIVVNHDGADDDNYHFCQIMPGEIRLYEMVGGTPNLLACGPNDGSLVTVYFDGATTGKFVATCGTTRIEATGVSGTGKYVGVALGNMDAGMAFDNFVFSKHKQDGNNCSAPGTPAGCEIGTEFFNRPDDPALGCAWIDLAGASEISGQSLAFTASSSKARFYKSNPAGRAMSVTVEWRSTAVNNVGEISVGANSTGTSRYAARIVCGASKTLSLVDPANAVLASAPVTTAISATYRLVVTLYGQRFCASLYAGETLLQHVLYVLPSPIATTGEYWPMLGCTSITGRVEFDNFRLSHAFSSPDHVECPQCVIATAENCVTDCCPELHYKMVVNIAGTLSNKATCVRCGEMGGEYHAVLGPCTYGYCSRPVDNTIRPCTGAAWDCDNDCDDGGVSGPGAFCDRGDSTASIGHCNGVFLYVSIRIDGAGKCFLVATILVMNAYCPSQLDNCRMDYDLVLAAAQYETPIGVDVVPCSGLTYTLNLYTGATLCQSTRRAPVGSTTFWLAPLTAGCNGTWPATITVYSLAS